MMFFNRFILTETEKHDRLTISGLLLFAFTLVGAALLTKSENKVANPTPDRNLIMCELNFSLDLTSCHQ